MTQAMKYFILFILLMPFSQSFGQPCTPIGTSWVIDATLKNTGAFNAIRVLSVTVDDTTYFVPKPPPLPYLLNPGETLTVPVWYTPLAVETNTTTLRMTWSPVDSASVYEAAIALTGCGQQESSVQEKIVLTEAQLHEAIRNGSEFAWLPPTPNPGSRLSAIRFTFALGHQANVVLELFDLLGKRIGGVHAANYQEGVHEISFYKQSLTPATYIYRFSVDGKPYSGMLTIR